MLYKNGLKLLRNWLWLKITWKNEQKILIWHFGICLGQCRTDGREYALNLRPITGAGFWKTSLTKVDNYHAKNLKNKQKQGTIVVKSIFSVHFLGDLIVPKRHFQINWPLVAKTTHSMLRTTLNATFEKSNTFTAWNVKFYFVKDDVDLKPKKGLKNIYVEVCWGDLNKLDSAWLWPFMLLW